MLVNSSGVCEARATAPRPPFPPSLHSLPPGSPPSSPPASKGASEKRSSRQKKSSAEARVLEWCETQPCTNAGVSLVRRVFLQWWAMRENENVHGANGRGCIGEPESALGGYEAMAPVETLLAPAATSERLCAGKHTRSVSYQALFDSKAQRFRQRSFFLGSFCCVNKWIEHLLLQKSLEFCRGEKFCEESKAKASTAWSWRIKESLNSGKFRGERLQGREREREKNWEVQGVHDYNKLWALMSFLVSSGGFFLFCYEKTFENL